MPNTNTNCNKLGDDQTLFQEELRWAPLGPLPASNIGTHTHTDDDEKDDDEEDGEDDDDDDYDDEPLLYHLTQQVGPENWKYSIVKSIKGCLRRYDWAK